MHNIDFDQTYLLVVQFNFFIILLIFTMQLRLFVDYMDLMTAFLNDFLNRIEFLLSNFLSLKLVSNLFVSFEKHFMI